MAPILELLAAQPALFVGVVVTFTLLIGSFLNVVIHRLPLMMHREWAEQCAELGTDEDGPDLSALPEKYNLVVPRSGCPSCGHKITALQNIPILSYLHQNQAAMLRCSERVRGKTRGAADRADRALFAAACANSGTFMTTSDLSHPLTSTPTSIFPFEKMIDGRSRSLQPAAATSWGVVGMNAVFVLQPGGRNSPLLL